ncbi:MAG: ABC transporter ATP-binding protein [Spirochaetaceae bacterium]|nr:ABC transporter ATP-binding protein [Spirochaetaceae bacterium]
MSFGFDFRPIFRDFSLELGGVNPVFILGPSGCGKTTLLRLIAGLLSPSAGSVKIEASIVGAPNTGTTTVGAASFVFQEPRLLPRLNVLENVALPLVRLLGRSEAESRARFFLHESSMRDCLTAYPGELSGGQRQRVSIARAWAYPAPLILMDEPFQSLDIPLRIQLMDAVRQLLRAESRFVIAVTHDPREAIYLGRRIIVLGSGDDGSAAVIFDKKFETSGDRRGFAPENSLEQRLISLLSPPPMNEL